MTHTSDTLRSWIGTGHTAHSLALAAGLDDSSLSRLVSGRSLPDRRTLERLAAALPAAWGEELVLAFLRDHCPPAYTALLQPPSGAALTPHPTTPLDRALSALGRHAAFNPEFRALLFDLARFVEGLP